MSSRPAIDGNNRRASEAAARVAAILRVATRLFLRHGYAGTSLDDVLARSGGSKATLRKYYKDKPGLFSAVIAEVTSRFVAESGLEVLKGPPDRVLRSFGQTVLGFYLATASLAAYRGVVAEGHRSRGMARTFYQQGHRLVQAALARHLAAWHRQGQLASSDPMADADLFLHLVRAGAYEQRLIGLRNEVGKAEIAARVKRAVQVYLGGLSARR